MKTLQMKTKAGSDGLLHFDVAVDIPNAEYEVLVVLQPPVNRGPQTAIEPSWHDAFDQLAGSVADETFFRQPQGQRENRLDLE